MMTTLLVLAIFSLAETCTASAGDRKNSAERGEEFCSTKIEIFSTCSSVLLMVIGTMAPFSATRGKRLILILLLSMMSPAPNRPKVFF